MPQTIAYLINQYPKVSHSFIRREIAAVEAHGLQVERFSIRSCSAELIDPADQQELSRTRFVLGVGGIGLLTSLFRVASTRPVRFLQTLGLTLTLSRAAERGLLHHLAYLAEACVLLGWFDQANIAHVHAHFGTNSTTVALLCNALGGPPYSFTVHGPEEFDKVKAISLVQKVARAAFVVAISNFGRSQLYRWCPLTDWSKIHLVHCGVDSEFLASAPAPLAPASEPSLVCVGRLCAEKGQLLLLEAASQLMQQGVAFKLVLVGDGPLRGELEILIKHLALHDRVKITGWASGTQVRQAILAARALVLPSFAEGLPVVIMEALALGRPVISTYVAGIPELIEPEACGWLVPPGSVEDLVIAMQKALQTPVEKLEEMGNIGAERVASCHSATIEASKLAALFRLNIEQLPQDQAVEPLKRVNLRQTTPVSHP
ncbi:colanic acid biosynthesis glycosyltransferase WcaL [Stenomitos frigidus ULC18]|uniref:Colanic acid biosynthesis glycosyltransferase WcaL n=2 Tax=Stenomitos TaxID=1844270 RepID=A0A2T1DZK1_9CYAN|nr:colanic acid biosynthesis glycosyltransferase WcaL [Stenomitos frigidus ULC18]